MQRWIPYTLLTALFGAYALADTYNFNFGELPSPKSRPSQTNPRPKTVEEPVPPPAATSEALPEGAQLSVRSYTPAVSHALSPWRLGLGGIYRGDWEKQTVENGRKTFGGILTLHWDPFRVLGVGAFAGLRDRTGGDSGFPYLVGMEAEIFPFRRSVEDLNRTELSVLLGMNLFEQAHQYQVTPPRSAGQPILPAETKIATEMSLAPYAGARFLYNISNEIGLTSVLRGNTGFFILEVGLMARL